MLKGLVSKVKLLVSSFLPNYTPPTNSENRVRLTDAICDAAEQGKLLVLKIGVNNNQLPVPLNLPPEDFIVYEDQYNTKFTFPQITALQTFDLPFIGIYYCETKSKVALVGRITCVDDIAVAYQCFENLRARLNSVRNAYTSRMEDTELIVNQESEYEEALNQIRMMEAEEERKIQEKQRKEKEIEQSISDARERFESLPDEPSRGTPGAVTLRIILPDGDRKIRSFMSRDPVQFLFDFVYINYAPEPITISFGVPKVQISDFSLSFEDSGFGRTENVVVEFE